jgi:hypothetical protein
MASPQRRIVGPKTIATARLLRGSAGGTNKAPECITGCAASLEAGQVCAAMERAITQ